MSQNKELNKNNDVELKTLFKEGLRMCGLCLLVYPLRALVSCMSIETAKPKAKAPKNEEPTTTALILSEATELVEKAREEVKKRI